MTLSDLRKFSIRKQFRVHFPLPNGMECVINEHGVAQVPALKTVPDFNLEQELARAGEFLLEPVIREGERNPPKPRSIGRDELEKMAAPAPTAGREDREEE